MKLNLNEYKHIHFVGIGGVSMYLLAIYCKNLDINVTGSDITLNKYVQKCKDNQIIVHLGHNRKNIKGADLLVCTSAIDRNNVEITEALNNSVEVIDRADLLATICKNYKCVIGISGTHGKTTTSAMIYHILRECGKSVSCHIGADILGARLNPKDDYLVLECCEYNRSFLKFDCDVAIVLNIDNDHLDCYGNMYNLRNAFRIFLKRAETRFIFDNITTKCIKNKAIRIKPPQVLSLNQFNSEGNSYLLDNVYGEHNINNATVAVNVCLELGLKYSKIYNALKTFLPAGRRCQKLGVIENCDIITDYAHHPSEIKCIYDSLKLKYNDVYLIFQPHTYSRTKILIHDFVKLFSGVDNLFIYKEYPARESKSKGYSAKKLTEYLDNAIYIKNLSQLQKWIKGKKFNFGSCVVFVGAGDINIIAEEILRKLIKRRY
ncbi:MAG: UDP-N-acetylmuramate--L-alanine ligase [Clostridia bacterium]